MAQDMELVVVGEELVALPEDRNINRSTCGCDEIDISPLAKDLSWRGAGTI